MTDNMTPELLLKQWEESKRMLDFWKEEENKNRIECFNTYFPNAQEGVNKVKLPDGSWLQGRKRVNCRIDKDWLEPTLQQLPADVANEIIKWTPSLVMSVYKNLSDREQEIVHEMVQFESGMPELKLKEKA